MTNQCTHGQLARVCELCEKDAEIARLRTINTELLEALKSSKEIANANAAIAKVKGEKS
jgi:hypothetical protein